MTGRGYEKREDIYVLVSKIWRRANAGVTVTAQAEQGKEIPMRLSKSLNLVSSLLVGDGLALGLSVGHWDWDRGSLARVWCRFRTKASGPKKVGGVGGESKRPMRGRVTVESQMHSRKHAGTASGGDGDGLPQLLRGEVAVSGGEEEKGLSACQSRKKGSRICSADGLLRCQVKRTKETCRLVSRMIVLCPGHWT